jgi:hypothetical protein
MVYVVHGIVNAECINMDELNMKRTSEKFVRECTENNGFIVLIVSGMIAYTETKISSWPVASAFEFE